MLVCYSTCMFSGVSLCVLQSLYVMSLRPPCLLSWYSALVRALLTSGELFCQSSTGAHQEWVSEWVSVCVCEDIQVCNEYSYISLGIDCKEGVGNSIMALVCIFHLLMTMICCVFPPPSTLHPVVMCRMLCGWCLATVWGAHVQLR